MKISFDSLKDYKHLLLVSFAIVIIAGVFIFIEFIDRTTDTTNKVAEPIKQTGTFDLRKGIDDDYIDVILYFDETDKKITSVSSLADIKIADVTVTKSNNQYTLTIKGDQTTYFTSLDKSVPLVIDKFGKNNNGYTNFIRELKFKVKNPKKLNQTSFYLFKHLKATPVYAQTVDYEFIHKNASNKDQSKVLDIVIMVCGFDAGPSDAESLTYETVFDKAKESILTASFFKDYTDSFNIIAIKKNFSDSELGCESIAGQISQSNEVLVQSIVSQVKGDVPVVIHARQGGGTATIPAALISENDPERFNKHYGMLNVDRVYDIKDGAQFRAIVHELGHTFCTLHDEFTGGIATGLPYPVQDKDFFINCKPTVNDFPAQYRPTQNIVECVFKDGLRSTQDSLMRREAKGDGEVFNKISYNACERAIKALDNTATPTPSNSPEPAPVPKPPPGGPKPPSLPVWPKVPKNTKDCNLDTMFCFL